jgi:4-hydroxy-2-oxoheptanedioate aldolase
MANSEITTLAMIETLGGIKNLEEILKVEKLDGIYIGPADLSLSLGCVPKFDVLEDPVYSQIMKIRDITLKAGKIAGI